MTTKSNPGVSFFAITKSDTTIFNPPTRGLWIGVAGNVTVQDASLGTAVEFVGVAAGTLLPIEVARVTAATTALSIVGIR